MTTYLVLGHGAYNPVSGPYPPEVLVPTDTTLKFFSDAGSALRIPFKYHENNKAKWGSDYDKVAPAWRQLQEEAKGKEGESELKDLKVTYNFTLYPDNLQEERDQARAADWNGAELILIPSGTRWLCEGTPQTCPTPELLTLPSSDERVLKPETWLHKCTGILGEYGGKGHVIHWAACSSILVVRPDLPPLVTASTAGPGVNVAEDWLPDNTAVDQIKQQNTAQIKLLTPARPVGLAAGGGIVLMGEDHRPGPASFVKRQGNMEEGQIILKKGGAFSKEKIEVKGISDKTNRSNIETALGELLPGKPVEFVR
jgi:hypothetical protein